MVSDVMFSSASEDWATPQDFFDALDAGFGFTLDVCATPDNAKCARYFTKEDDGLAQDWGTETCWCNPPYGRTMLAWVHKAWVASLGGAVVVMLAHARTDTRWFHFALEHGAETRFIKGRLKFGGSKNSAPFPSVVLIFRPKGA